MAAQSASIALTVAATNDSGMIFLFEQKEFLKLHGWTVHSSSDGTTFGLGDNILAYTDLTDINSWMILQSPDSAQQILWYRTSSTDNNWFCRRSPDASYSGGDASGTPPTATTDHEIHPQTTILAASATNVMQITCEDAAPYGWASKVHASGNFNDPQGGYALVPMIAAQPNDTDPYVFVWAQQQAYEDSIIGNDAAATSSAHATATVPGALGSANVCGAWSYFAVSQLAVPNNCPPDSNTDDILFPVPWGRRSTIAAPQMFKGFSNFMCWNGVQRAVGETFNAKTRCSFGDLNVPWNSAVTPSNVG